MNVGDRVYGARFAYDGSVEIESTTIAGLGPDIAFLTDRLVAYGLVKKIDRQLLDLTEDAACMRLWLRVKAVAAEYYRLRREDAP